MRQEPATRRGPNRKWALALCGLVVVFVLLAGYDLITSGNLLSAKPAASPAATPSHSVPAVATGGASASGTGSTGKPGKATPSSPASGSPSAAVSPAGLTAVSVAAFGPDGTSDGDNPKLASLVLTGNGTEGWSSAWYKTADFGELQAGTGLLFDMGRQVSISGLQVQLGPAAGADVQVRLGDTPDMAGLSEAASANDVGSTVQFPLSAPVSARYVLIWFTLLPPDTAGTYQVTVYKVTVDGQP